MGITPDYFWDDMTLREADEILGSHVDTYRDSWEQTRIIAYNSAAGMTKLPPMTQFMPFEWDNEREDNKPKAKPSKKRMLEIANNNVIKTKNGKL